MKKRAGSLNNSSITKNITNKLSRETKVKKLLKISGIVGGVIILGVIIFLIKGFLIPITSFELGENIKGAVSSSDGNNLLVALEEISGVSQIILKASNGVEHIGECGGNSEFPFPSSVSWIERLGGLSPDYNCYINVKDIEGLNNFNDVVGIKIKDKETEKLVGEEGGDNEDDYEEEVEEKPIPVVRTGGGGGGSGTSISDSGCIPNSNRIVCSGIYCGMTNNNCGDAVNCTEVSGLFGEGLNCSNGIWINESRNCTDPTDNYWIKDYVYNGSLFEDVCLDSNNLTEFLCECSGDCSGDEIVVSNISYECLDGCGDGACQFQICSAQLGDICTDEEYCPGNELVASDSDKCCDVDCIVAPPIWDSCSECGGALFDFNLCDEVECNAIIEDCYYEGLLNCDSCFGLSCYNYDNEADCGADVCGFDCGWDGGSCVSGSDIFSGSFDGWRAVITKTQTESEQEILPGEGMQFPHSMVRSYSNPEYIYWAHDCGQGWRSRNSGETWERFLAKGLGSVYGQSIEVDPANPNTIFITVDNLWNTPAIVDQGLYKSTDGGDNWEFVLPVDYNEGENNDVGNRPYKHNIAYALNSISEGEAKIWYAVFADDNLADKTNGQGLYKSTDGGDNWDKTSANVDGHIYINALYVHPENNDIVYLGSNNGLYQSTDGGNSLNLLDDLPLGYVASIQIDQTNPNEIYVVVRDNGLYKSINGGADFLLLREADDSVGVSINQGYPEVIYFLKKSGIEVSQDGGISWDDVVSYSRASKASGWGSEITPWDGLGAIIPNPNNRCEAVGYGQAYLWKTINCIDFSHANNLFSGFAWTTRDSVMFDLNNPDKFGIFGADIGLFISEDAGKSFVLVDTGSILSDWGYLFNSNDMKAGAFQPSSNRFVGSGGNIWGLGNMGIAYSESNNGPWQSTDAPFGPDNGQAYRNYFYNPNSPEELFVYNLKSTDGGVTFNEVDYLVNNGLEVYKMTKSDSNIIYATNSVGNQIYRSIDGGVNFNLYVSKTSYGYPSGAVSSYGNLVFDVDPVDANKIYTLYDADLAMYNGSTWQPLGLLNYIRSLEDNSDLVDLHSHLAYPGIVSVIVDPNNGSIIYATVEHAGVSSIYRSIDGGDNWEDISYNLPRANYGSAFSINPHSGEIFVGSASGTWIFPPLYNLTTSIYMNSVSRPSCNDGLKNGDETGIDEGGGCDVEIIPTAKCSDINTSCGDWPNCNNCNLQDTCVGGEFLDYSCSGTSCISASPKSCDDSDICTTDSCSSSGCLYSLINLDTSQSCCQRDYSWLGGEGELSCCGDDLNEASPYQVIETNCADGNDNDCDGNPDCFDSDCMGASSCGEPGELPVGYLSWWRFENNANDEAENNDGILIGDYEFVGGKIGKSVRLNGDNDYVSIPSSSSINSLENEITVSLWHNSAIPYSSYSSYAQLFGFYKNDDNHFMCGYTSGYPEGRLFCFNKINSVITSNYHFSDCQALQDNVWTNLVVVINSSACKVYINGTLCETGALATNLSKIGSDLNFRIGSTDSYSLRDFNGSIDEVIVYNRSLNSTEIGEIYCGQGGDAEFCEEEPIENTFYVSVAGDGDHTGLGFANAFNLGEAQINSSGMLDVEITYLLAGGDYGRYWEGAINGRPYVDSNPTSIEMQSPDRTAWHTWKADMQGVFFEEIYLGGDRNAYLKFEGITLIQENDEHSEESVIDILCSSFVELNNLTIIGVWGNYLDITSQGILVHSTTGCSKINNISIIGCEINDSEAGIRFNDEAGGLGFGSGINILDNHIYHTAGTAMGLVTESEHDMILIKNNYFHNEDPVLQEEDYTHGSGVTIKYYGNVSVIGNTIHDFASSGGIKTYLTTINPIYDDLIIEDNILYDVGAIYAVSLENLGHNIYINNNTIIGSYPTSGSGQTRYGTALRILPQNETTPSNINFYDNLVVGAVQLRYNDLILENFNEDNNIFWSCLNVTDLGWVPAGQGNLQGANTIIITGDISEPDLFESDFFVNVNYSRGDDFIRYLNGGPNKIYNLDYHLYANTIACDGSANGQEGVAVGALECVDVEVEQPENTFYVSVTGYGDHNGSLGDEFNLSDVIDHANDHFDDEITFLLAGGRYGIFDVEDISRTDWVTWKADVGAIPEFDYLQIYNHDYSDTYIRLNNLTVNSQIPAGSNPNDDPWTWGKIPDSIYFFNANHVEINNCKIRTQNSYLAQYSINLINTNNTLVNNCDISEGKAGVKGVNSENLNITNNYIHNLSRGSGISLTGSGENILIENNHMYQLSNYNMSADFFPRDFIYVNGSDYWGTDPGNPPLFNVDDVITQGTTTASFEGVRWDGIRWLVYVVMDNPAEFNSGEDISASISGLAFQSYAHSQQFHIGSMIASHISNVIVRNNTLHDFLGQGIYFYAGESYSNVLIEKNLIYNVGSYTAVDGVNASVEKPVIIRNNTFIGRVNNDGHSGGAYVQMTNRYGGQPFAVGMEGSGNEGTGLFIYNNLIVGKRRLPDPVLYPNYVEDYNIWWTKDTDDVVTSNSFVAIWNEGATLHGYPEYFESLDALDQYTSEYPLGSIPTDFFVNPKFYTKKEVWESEQIYSTQGGVIIDPTDNQMYRSKGIAISDILPPSSTPTKWELTSYDHREEVVDADYHPLMSSPACDGSVTGTPYEVDGSYVGALECVDTEEEPTENTFYVSVNGDGEHDGSLGDEFNLSEAIDHANENTDVEIIFLLDGGRYENGIDLYLNWNERANWVTFKADVGETPVLDKIAIFQEDQQNVYLRFKDLKIEIPDDWYLKNTESWGKEVFNWTSNSLGGREDHSPYEGIGYPENFVLVYLENNKVYKSLLDDNLNHEPIVGVNWENWWVEIADPLEAWPMKWFDEDDAPTVSGIYMTDNSILIENANHIEVINCTIRGLHKHLTSVAVYAVNSDYLNFSYNDMNRLHRGVTTIGCKDQYFAYNDIQYMGAGSGFSLQYSKGDIRDLGPVIIEGNHIYNQSKDNDYDDGHCDYDYCPWDYHGGSGIALKIDDAVIRDNIINNFQGQGILSYDDTHYDNLVIENNLLYDIGGRIFDLNNADCREGGVNLVKLRNNTIIGNVMIDPDFGSSYDGLHRYSLDPFSISYELSVIPRETIFDGIGLDDCNFTEYQRGKLAFEAEVEIVCTRGNGCNCNNDAQDLFNWSVDIGNGAGKVVVGEGCTNTGVNLLDDSSGAWSTDTIYSNGPADFIEYYGRYYYNNMSGDNIGHPPNISLGVYWAENPIGAGNSVMYWGGIDFEDINDHTLGDKWNTTYDQHYSNLSCVEISRNIIVGRFYLPNVTLDNVKDMKEEYNLAWRYNDGTGDKKSTGLGETSFIIMWQLLEAVEGSTLRGYPMFFEDLREDFGEYNSVWTPNFPIDSVPVPFFVNPGFYTENLSAPSGSENIYKDHGRTDLDYHPLMSSAICNGGYVNDVKVLPDAVEGVAWAGALPCVGEISSLSLFARIKEWFNNLFYFNYLNF